MFYAHIVLVTKNVKNTFSQFLFGLLCMNLKRHWFTVFFFFCEHCASSHKKVFIYFMQNIVIKAWKMLSSVFYANIIQIFMKNVKKHFSCTFSGRCANVTDGQSKTKGPWLGVACQRCTINSKINGTPQRFWCLFAHFEVTFYFSRSEFICT